MRQPLAADMHAVPSWERCPAQCLGGWQRAEGYASRVKWKYGEDYRKLFAEVMDTFTRRTH